MFEFLKASCFGGFLVGSSLLVGPFGATWLVLIWLVGSGPEKVFMNGYP